MKTYILLIATFLTLTGCAYDNFEPPKSTFEGRLVYKGEPLLMQSANVAVGNNSDFPVFLELWQKAYNNRSSIRIPIKQDGTFSSLLFDGEYKLIVPNGQGPFLWKRTASNTPDSLNVTVQGSQKLDIEVMPYYMLRNPKMSLSGRKVSGSVSLEKVITDATNGKAVERVSLYVNRTQFVDAGNSLNKADLAGADIKDIANVSLTTADLPALVPAQAYVYARIGLKISGVEDMIYTPVQKIDL
ncbi:DUF3823 domain-containing protein [Spirosoma sp. BT702]|uniref:DUF3823 domain-containing protein n=1 Tax=Spirosoma profusum TaxID=2771354 RepID=A0A927AUC3_9BACT|nr:DUF3823 domain-containing protein [Spirosoma profusum]MBD2703557.1 DUF3823 domain-containing protein [Spirosoma profusum]